jgi:hypothetical protein
MPYSKLVQLKRFSPRQVKQLLDERRIITAWFSSMKRGKKIFSAELNRAFTLDDIIDRYARVTAKLLGLGYKLLPSRKTTSYGRLLAQLSKSKIKLYLKK